MSGSAPRFVLYVQCDPLPDKIPHPVAGYVLQPPEIFPQPVGVPEFFRQRLMILRPALPLLELRQFLPAQTLTAGISDDQFFDVDWMLRHKIRDCGRTTDKSSPPSCYIE